MRTDMGQEMVKDFSETALREIEREARLRASLLRDRAKTPAAERDHEIGAHFGDALKYERLAEAIGNLLADDRS